MAAERVVTRSLLDGQGRVLTATGDEPRLATPTLAFATRYLPRRRSEANRCGGRRGCARNGARAQAECRRDTGTTSAGSAVLNAEVHDADTRPLLRQAQFLCGELRLDGLTVE